MDFPSGASARADGGEEFCITLGLCAMSVGVDRKVEERNKGRRVDGG